MQGIHDEVRRRMALKYPRRAMWRRPLRGVQHWLIRACAAPLVKVFATPIIICGGLLVALYGIAAMGLMIALFLWLLHSIGVLLLFL
jgi:hypothetical protein